MAQTTGTIPVSSPPVIQEPQEVHNPAPSYHDTNYNGEQYNDKSPAPAPSVAGLPTQPAVESPTPAGFGGPMQQNFTHQTAPRVQYNYTTPLGSLQQGPAPVDCPACAVREMTRTEAVTGGTTHLAALLFCCVACLGCIPYLASWFKDVKHRCGRCGALLAVWHRSGRTEVMPLVHAAGVLA